MIIKDRVSNSGKLNAMYGKSIKDIMSPESYESWRISNKLGQIKSYRENPDRCKEISRLNIERFKNPQQRLKLKIKNSKRVYMFNEDGEFVKKFDNIDDAISFLGIKNHVTIKKNIKLNKKYKGYYWLREEIEGVETIETNLNYFKLTE